MNLSIIDWLIMLVYFVFVLGIGFALKRYMRTSNDFFLAGRSIPAWVCGLAFISANLGAQEVIGMGASGAKYGIITSHFYWIGAIPAMIFVGIFMMPFYYGSKARSVPEYLRLRFDEKTRAVNAFSFAIMTVLSSGISMYAMALLIQTLGLLHGIVPDAYIFHVSVFLSAIIVLGYIFLGGLTSAIYNEVLQFFLIVAGFAPLVWIGLRNVGGWQGIKHTLPANMTHSWQGMAHASTNTLGVEWVGLAMGLGFVLSFGYWCTDFLVIQRAMAADSEVSARRVPLIAAVPKMFFPFLVILPGLIAVSVTSHMATTSSVSTAALATTAPSAPTTSANGTPLPLDEAHPHGIIPVKTDPVSGRAVLNADGTPVYNYDLAIPVMLLHFFPTGILGLGLTALLASFMSGMAGNVTAFNTVWTYDIYQAYINKKATDAHYLWMGRMATIGGVALSIAAAYLVTNFNNIMDALQLVFSIVNAPLFATFLLGMFWKTHHRPRRLHRPALRHRRRTHPPRPHSPRRRRPRHPRRLDHRRPPLPQRHGPELLDRHLRLLRQLPRHHCHQPHHQAAPRTRTRRPRLLANPETRRRSPKLVPETRNAGRSRPRHPYRPQPRLRLMP